MPMNKLKEFLDNNQVKYTAISHSPAYTAQEIAALTHVRGREMAKTVIVKIDGALAMVVLPASYQVDLNLLKQATNAQNVELASEAEFKSRFPDCETGAMPPFGRLYGMPTYVADALALDKEIFFNACSHSELIKMSYADFERLASPRVVKLSTAAARGARQ